MASPPASAAPSRPPLGSWAITRTGHGIERRPIPRNLLPLKKTLLELGGERVVIVLDSYEKDILRNGAPVVGGVPAIDGARPSSCHQTAAILAALAPRHRQIMTGYALSEDGCWRRHSWAMQGGEVVEPTEERVLYFGFALAGLMDLLRFMAPEIPIEVLDEVTKRVSAGRMGGEVFKSADLVRVQRLIDASQRATP